MTQRQLAEKYDIIIVLWSQKKLQVHLTTEKIKPRRKSYWRLLRLQNLAWQLSATARGVYMLRWRHS